MVLSTKFPELSNNTLVKLATTLKIDNYRLFLPKSITETYIEKTTLQDLATELQKIPQTKFEKTSTPNSTTPSKKEA